MRQEREHFCYGFYKQVKRRGTNTNANACDGRCVRKRQLAAVCTGTHNMLNERLNETDKSWWQAFAFVLLKKAKKKQENEIKYN